MKSSLRTRLKRLENKDGAVDSSWDVVWVMDWDRQDDALRARYGEAGKPKDQKVLMVGFQRPEA
jgi:hypothetical protein